MKIKIHRGVMLFALIWALAAFLPPAHEAARTLKVLVSPPLVAARVLRQNSTDPVALVWSLEENWLIGSENKEAALDKWDKLITHFPSQTWIAAARLRMSMREIPYSKATLPKISEASRRRIEKAVDIAAQAEKIEPDNAFWPWTQAAFDFALGQSSQGVAAMERAGKAKRLGDYAQSISRARLKWWTQHDDPTWEERSTILYYQETYPEWTVFRGASERAAREMARAHQRGDNTNALDIGAALLRANEILDRDSGAFIGGLVAQENGRNVLSTLFGTKLKTNDRNYDGRQLYSRKLRQRWIAHCRTNGRSELANRADWLLRIDTFNNEYFSKLFMQAGLKAPWGVVGGFAPYSLLVLAGWCFLLAIVWLGGVALLQRGQHISIPTRGQVATCANFGFWSLATTWLVVGAFRRGELLTMLTPGFGGINLNEFPGRGFVNFAFVFAFLCWLLPVFFTTWKRGRRFRWVRSVKEARALGRKFGRARLIAWLLFFVFTVVVASNGRGLWDGTLLQTAISAPVTLLCLGIALSLENIRFRREGRGFPRLRVEGDIPPRQGVRAWKWLRNGLILIAATCFYVALGGADADCPPLLSAIGFPVGIVATGAAVVLNRKVSSGDGFAFRLAVQSAGVLSLAFSFAFVVLSLGAWPIRAELNRQLDRRLSMKEGDWIKEQVAKNSPSSP